ncbi:MAG: cytochrome C biogenesis protein [Candidatus Glassbacteria bacterium RBG_16_58_8]|uniref:Cytochrome C biogenesis protein n=1 Tax=Candidatus Glassbacteria bacterium RBG_16_58_8 TaxID=1817866 RepID=A0A1F5YC96_9BACT|nr:MAG: cytochrome C biogenesis protein [Candidatus Glassbacteria bacterium RBG_16_58_8]
MSEHLIGAVSAFWLGILTSISPCPMATNIAAISYVSRQISQRRVVFLAGLVYTFGRMILYAGLAVLLTTFLLSAPILSFFLQKYMNMVLGPTLIIVGLILLEWIRFGGPGGEIGDTAQRQAGSAGIWGAFSLGFVFALSFCPLSAALFFGSLLPLSVKCGSSVVIPAFYGLGTGLPVVLFAFLLSFGFQAVGNAFDKLSVLERWLRRLTGVVFILVGGYFSLIYIFHLSL